MSAKPREKKTFELSPSTIRVYTSKLKTAAKLGILLDGSMSFKEINKIIDDYKNDKNEPYKKSSILTFMNAFQWKLNDNIENDKIQQISCDIETYINMLNHGIRQKMASGVLQNNHKKNFINWEVILEIYTEVEYLRNVSKKYYKNYLILSLYILFGGVRRVADFALMYIVDTFDETSDNIELNYYSKRNKLFTFNNYKTRRTYGVQHFNVSPKLDEIIVTYIERYNVSGFLLSKKTESNDKKPFTLSKKIMKIFKTYLPNHNIGANILRHSYVNYIMTNIHDKSNKRLIARRMAHSNDMQADYQLKYDIIEVNILKNNKINEYVKWCLTDNEDLTLDKVEQLKILHTREIKRQSKKRVALKKVNENSK